MDVHIKSFFPTIDDVGVCAADLSLRADKTGRSAQSSCSTLQPKPREPPLSPSVPLSLKCSLPASSVGGEARRSSWSCPGALGGAPDVLLRSLGLQRLWRFLTHPLLSASFTISSHFKFDLKIILPSTHHPLCVRVVALIETANCNQIS